MGDTGTDPMLRSFVDRVRRAVPTVAVWAHGSLALGDFQPGRSDLDLIAVLAEAPSAETRERLVGLHRRLRAEEPTAEKLHCSYLARDALAEAGADHLTWAHGGMLKRPVTPVSRRELLDGGLTFHGPAPVELLPPLLPGQLASFIRQDLAEFWLPATRRPLLWLRDVWVDFGPVVLARATVTLREDRLITKGEALTELLAMGAPADLVQGIRDRRYAAPAPVNPLRRVRRGLRTRAFVRHGIERALALPPRPSPEGR
ncbi:nucleotidyltransferase domain-containing protein [Kitasatospora sp. NPDC096147]|uniref:nucleotidyltransferase domain-containing protein n=1 Tax=Kitasatospora sp. NPDC096147 TaxID=3364093 RepID=UPI00381B9278